MHQRLGAGGVALADGGEEAAMFFQRLFQASVEPQRIAAGELEHFAQIVDGLLEPAVAGEFMQRLMKGLIDLEKAVGIARGGMAFELFMQRRQPVEVGGRGFVHRLESAASFEQRHERENVVEIALGQFGDIAAAARLERHQPFGGEHLERLAQGRATDAVLLGQRLLVDPRARRQLVREDAQPQTLGDFLIEGGLVDVEGVHFVLHLI